jgi:hypothetical protein
MRKQAIVAATAIVLGIAAGIGGALAAETGTKTLPDSSTITRRPIKSARHRRVGTADR